MLAVLDGYWIRVAVVVAVALASWLIRAAARAGHYPRLPEPEPGTEPTRADRLRYYGSVVLALGVGLVAGGLLWLVPPRQDADDLFRFAVFDQPAARLLAPLFVTLSVAALVSYRIAAGLIAPGPLLHLLRNGARRMGLADPRPATTWLARFVLAAALMLHFGDSHTTFEAGGVRWQTWPWQAEQFRPWSEVAEVRVVRISRAPNGRAIDRPHLSIAFSDGEVIRIGTTSDRPADFWERPATIAAEHGGVEVRHVDED